MSSSSQCPTSAQSIVYPQVPSALTVASQERMTVPTNTWIQRGGGSTGDTPIQCADKCLQNCSGDLNYCACICEKQCSNPNIDCSNAVKKK